MLGGPLGPTKKCWKPENNDGILQTVLNKIKRLSREIWQKTITDRKKKEYGIYRFLIGLNGCKSKFISTSFKISE